MLRINSELSDIGDTDLTDETDLTLIFSSIYTEVKVAFGCFFKQTAVIASESNERSNLPRIISIFL